MTRDDADKALKALEALSGPKQCEEAVGRFIHEVREQLPEPHRPFGSKEAREAHERAVRQAAERGAGPDSHKTTARR